MMNNQKIPFSAISLSFQYCFYNSYFRDFPGGPVGAALRAAGASIETLSVCILLTFALALAFCFNDAWQRLVKRRGLKLLLLLCTFLSVMLLPLARDMWLIFIFAILGAFTAGTVMGRSLYSMLYLSGNIHPSFIVAVMYSIFQVYIHAFDIMPAVLRTLPMYYAVGAPTLVLGLFFFFFFDGEEMERRRVLPENKLRLITVWPVLAFFVLAQTSFAFYEAILFPQMPVAPLDPVLKIIPNAVVLPILFIFGRKIKIRGVLACFAVAFACAVLAFLTNMGLAATQMFTEPTYRFYDLFFFWVLLSAFRMYGRNNARVKLFISINIALGVVVVLLAQLLFPLLKTGAVDAIPLFVIVVGFFLLIPKAEQAVTIMDAQGEYAESRSEYHVSLPDQREDILAARDMLLKTLPPGVRLEAEEQTVLAYLLDGQYADVTAHFMDVPIRKVGALTNAVIAKFGCKNKNELIAVMGAARAGFEQRERMRNLLESDSFTREERDIALLLTEGFTQYEISRKLSMTSGEVGAQIARIREKVGVKGSSDPVISAAVLEYKLTKREVDMLWRLLKGMGNSEIAAELFLSEETVRIHVRNLMKKLNLANRHSIERWSEAFKAEKGING
jgi:DNA-binding CsgD family transcriptional regulator